MEAEDRMAVRKERLNNLAVIKRSYMGSSRRSAARSSRIEKTVLIAEGMWTDILEMGIGVGSLSLKPMEEDYEL